MPADVVERGLDAVHHRDRQHGIQPFRGEILRRRGRQLRADVARAGHRRGSRSRARARSATSTGSSAGAMAASISSVSVAPQTPVRRILAFARMLARHGRVGGGVDIGVAEPLGMGEDRDPRLLHHPGHQPLAAARDDQVDQPRGAQHGADEGAVGGGGDLHRGLRQAGGAQPVDHAGMDGGGAAGALRPAAQDHRVAGLQAERGGIGRHVRPALEDHADDAERLGDAADAAARSAASHSASTRPTGSGSAATSSRPLGHRLDPGGGQGQAVLEGGGEVRARRRHRPRSPPGSRRCGRAARRRRPAAPRPSPVAARARGCRRPRGRRGRRSRAGGRTESAMAFMAGLPNRERIARMARPGQGEAGAAPAAVPRAVTDMRL